MARQTTDVGFPLLPAGTYTFTVTEQPEKRRGEKGGAYYLWKFSAVSMKMGDKVRKTKLLMFPTAMKPLLLVLGGKPDPENKESIIWDDEEVIGKRFAATVVHQKTKTGQIRENLEDITPCTDEWD